MYLANNGGASLYDNTPIVEAVSSLFQATNKQSLVAAGLVLAFILSWVYLSKYVFYPLFKKEKE